MTCSLRDGQHTWSMSRDNEGHRDYTIVFIVESAATDGPANVLSCPGLPVIGSQWAFGGDSDPWATCKMEGDVKPEAEGEPNTVWKVTLHFSTKADGKKCQDQQFDDPLTQPVKVSGGGNKYNEEATEDRNGLPIVNSAFEQIRGPQVEFDANRPTVKVEMNVASFTAVNLALSMQDCVNDSPLWNQSLRCIKLSTVNWEKKYYGMCYVYYTLSLEFDISPYPKTFDRMILDEGTKVLNGHWSTFSGAWTIDPINGLLAPPAPGLKVENAGGTLDVGVYSYRIAALKTLEGSTQAGAANFIGVTQNGSKITLSWPVVPGATSYDVFGRTAGNEKFIANVPENGYVDDGTVGTPTFIPPATNGTGTPANHLNPAHFIHAKDRAGENMRVILDGKGLPADVGVTTSVTGTGTLTGPGNIKVEKYREANFFLLGVPSTL